MKVERLIGAVMMPCELHQLKAGDIFRALDRNGRGPLVIAQAEPAMAQTKKKVGNKIKRGPDVLKVLSTICCMRTLNVKAQCLTKSRH